MPADTQRNQEPGPSPRDPAPRRDDAGQRADPPRPHAPEQEEPPRPHGDPNAPLVPGHEPARH